jgi:hypothetical protein
MTTTADERDHHRQPAPAHEASVEGAAAGEGPQRATARSTSTGLRVVLATGLQYEALWPKHYWFRLNGAASAGPTLAPAAVTHPS